MNFMESLLEIKSQPQQKSDAELSKEAAKDFHLKARSLLADFNKIFDESLKVEDDSDLQRLLDSDCITSMWVGDNIMLQFLVTVPRDHKGEKTPKISAWKLKKCKWTGKN